jgi:hypothetical protein
VISADEFVDDARADEAGTARDEIAHAGILLRFLIVARRDYRAVRIRRGGRCGAVGVRLNIA